MKRLTVDTAAKHTHVQQWIEWIINEETVYLIKLWRMLFLINIIVFDIRKFKRKLYIFHVSKIEIYFRHLHPSVNITMSGCLFEYACWTGCWVVGDHNYTPWPWELSILSRIKKVRMMCDNAYNWKWSTSSTVWEMLPLIYIICYGDDTFELLYCVIWLTI